MRILLLILGTLSLPACTTTSGGGLPTSARLENVRAQKEAPLQQVVHSRELAWGAPTFIRIFKQERALEIWMQDEETEQYRQFKSYPICRFSGALGPKLAEGDKQSPEGFYTIGADQMNPWSRYHLSFNLGFPNKYDEALGRTGSALMVHGGCESIGCYAMTDNAMEEIYLLTEASIANGHNVPVHIFPFRMTPMNMFMHSGGEWTAFWHNLKQGYDAFEIAKTPPAYSFEERRYGFNTTDTASAPYF